MTARRQRGQGKRERRISVRTIRRDPPDLRKLSRAVLALAQAEADAKAQSKIVRETKNEETVDESD